MIDETYRQLKIAHHSQLIVSFVLLPVQRNVYDVFINQLNVIKMVNSMPTTISFDKQSV